MRNRHECARPSSPSMDKGLVEILADPVSGEALELEPRIVDDGEVVEGALRGAGGRSYAIKDGIPRFVEIEDPGQQQTADTFGYKWQQRDSYDSPGFREFALGWFLERYGFGSEQELRDFFRGRRLTLDAGCGSGFSSSLWMTAGWRDGSDAEWIGARHLGGDRRRAGSARRGRRRPLRPGRRVEPTVPRRDLRRDLLGGRAPPHAVDAWRIAGARDRSSRPAASCCSTSTARRGRCASSRTTTSATPFRACRRRRRGTPCAR